MDTIPHTENRLHPTQPIGTRTWRPHFLRVHRAGTQPVTDAGAAALRAYAATHLVDVAEIDLRIVAPMTRKGAVPALALYVRHTDAEGGAA